MVHPSDVYIQTFLYFSVGRGCNPAIVFSDLFIGPESKNYRSNYFDRGGPTVTSGDSLGSEGECGVSLVRREGNGWPYNRVLRLTFQ